MTDSARGFTIIEVVLFLGITGALFAALMIGVGTGITQQRYQDSVRSYKALLQDQYAAVLNTRNEGGEALGCNDADKVVDSTASAVARGTTRCVILGRAVVVGKDSNNQHTTVTVSSVTGYEPVTPVHDDDDDYTAIAAYNPKIATFDAVTSQLDWQMSLKTPADNRLAQSTFLILRSPSSGLVRVFAVSDALGSGRVLSDSHANYIASTYATNNIANCVSGDSGLLPKQVVAVDPTIASADGISSQTLTSGSCS